MRTPASRLSGKIRPGTPRFRPVAQLFWLAIALAVGTALVAQKVHAQNAVLDAGLAHTRDAAVAVRRATGHDAGTVVAITAIGDAGAIGDGQAVATADASSNWPMDYAVLPSPQDLDPTLSEEQQRAIGTGLVPIHREGLFRSPLAHPRFGPAAHVRVGLVLNRIRDYEIRTGSFSADFFLSLTGDRAMPALEIRFANGTDVDQFTLADAPTFKAYRIRGTFTSPVDLRRYPFDTQSLTIEMEAQREGVDQVVFAADPERTSLDEGFSIAGWGVAAIGARAYRHLYPPRFDRDDLYVSRYKFETRIDRFGISAAFSVYVPAFIIILIGLTGLWVPASRVDVRSATGAPMLAAAVLFHYSLMQALPATGYLTRADKVMMGLYISLLLNMLSTWMFFVVRESRVDKVFHLSRLSVPPITFAIMIAASTV